MTTISHCVFDEVCETVSFGVAAGVAAGGDLCAFFCLFLSFFQLFVCDDDISLGYFLFLSLLCLPSFLSDGFACGNTFRIL